MMTTEEGKLTQGNAFKSSSIVNFSINNLLGLALAPYDFALYTSNTLVPHFSTFQVEMK
jgi:hypothetical protein